MHVRLSDPRLAEELLGFLRRADCIVDVGDVEAHAEGVAVEVEVPRAYDDEQARMEVSLYLRVWEAMHPGSGVELLAPANPPSQGSPQARFAPISTTCAASPPRRWPP